MANTTGKKFGGRKKGTPNKVTKATRELFSSYVEEHFKDFVEKMEALDERDYCRVYTDMCKYVMPALQSVNLDATVQQKKTIEDKLAELSAEE